MFGLNEWETQLFLRGVSVGAVLGVIAFIMLLYATSPPKGGGGSGRTT